MALTARVCWVGFHAGESRSGVVMRAGPRTCSLLKPARQRFHHHPYTKLDLRKDRYQRGESKAFTKRLYTPAGQKAFDEVARKYRADRNFKQTVDRYITEFERLLDEVARDERGPAILRSHLTSETGLVYTLLAHAAGRLG